MTDKFSPFTIYIPFDELYKVDSIGDIIEAIYERLGVMFGHQTAIPPIALDIKVKDDNLKVTVRPISEDEIPLTVYEFREVAKLPPGTKVWHGVAFNKVGTILDIDYPGCKPTMKEFTQHKFRNKAISNLPIPLLLTDDSIEGLKQHEIIVQLLRNMEQSIEAAYTAKLKHKEELEEELDLVGAYDDDYLEWKQFHELSLLKKIWWILRNKRSIANEQ